MSICSLSHSHLPSANPRHHYGHVLFTGKASTVQQTLCCLQDRPNGPKNWIVVMNPKFLWGLKNHMVSQSGPWALTKMFTLYPGLLNYWSLQYRNHPLKPPQHGITQVPHYWPSVQQIHLNGGLLYRRPVMQHWTLCAFRIMIISTVPSSPMYHPSCSADSVSDGPTMPSHSSKNTDQGQFHVGFMSSLSKSCENMGCPYIELIIQTGHHFAHAMTAELSWHVQNYDLLKSLE